jgi:hypothetical protein
MRVRRIATTVVLMIAVAFDMTAAPLAAQVTTVDPSSAAVKRGAVSGPAANDPYYGSEVPASSTPQGSSTQGTSRGAGSTGTGSVDRAIAKQAAKPDPTETYQEDDILGAAESVFGRGAEGLAKAIEDILKKQGRPNAYIGGREVGGAFVAGLRYGSGTLHHKVEGDRPIYWTGPSVGFDFGANGAKTFVLVYNLYDSQDIFRRYGAAEGAAYVVGGFTISYLRRGDIVLIPVRLGVGWRLGASLGYMKFSEKAKVLPF